MIQGDVLTSASRHARVKRLVRVLRHGQAAAPLDGRKPRRAVVKRLGQYHPHDASPVPLAVLIRAPLREVVRERRSGWPGFARIAVVIARLKAERLSAVFGRAWSRFCEKAHRSYISCKGITLRHERGDDGSEPYKSKTTGGGGLDGAYPGAASLPGR